MHKPPVRKYLLHDEFQRLLAVVQHSVRDRALVLLIYEAALRAAEPGRLQLQDAGLLHKRMVFVHRGKGSKEGYVELSTTTTRAVHDWIEYCYPNKVHRKPTDWLFPGVRGPRNTHALNGLSRFAVWRLIRSYCEEAGIELELAHPHILKHTRIMDLYTAIREAGGHPHDALPSVAKLVGHREAKTTLEWYLSESEEQKSVVRRATQDRVTLKG